MNVKQGAEIGQDERIVMNKDGTYPVVVEKGPIRGSVRVVGTLPDPLAFDDVAKLITALSTVHNDFGTSFSHHEVHIKLKGTRCRT
jgi:hypothetical protein